MDGGNHLAQQDEDLAAGGSNNQPRGDGSNEESPYAWDGNDSCVTTEATRCGGRGADDKTGGEPFT